MNFLRKTLLASTLLWILGYSPILAQMPPLLPSQRAPLSERVVAYQIDAKYAPKTHSLDAQETLTWTNYTGQPQDKLPFHLYLNAFQPKSTFTREGYEGGNRDVEIGAKWDDKKFGEDQIKSLEVVGMGDLTNQLRFIHPDDDNLDDKSVVELQLPRPVAPGESIMDDPTAPAVYDPSKGVAIRCSTNQIC